MRARAFLGAALLSTWIPAQFPPALTAPTATVEVSIGDNFFEPQEIRIDVGDSVVWNGGGIRPHTVTSDDGLFDSGRMNAPDEFTFTFDNEGTYFYHCTLHGSPQRGMWGKVVVGEPEIDKRPRLVVPDDYPTIQSAVDHASPQTLIVVRPGTYEESVTVGVPRISIKGVDRFRTVLNGNDTLATGINVTANRVGIKNLTIRNFTDDGVLFDRVSHYTATRVDSIKNRRYGIRASGSFEGVIRESYGYGSGTAAFAVESCFGCGTLVDHVRATTNFAGVLGLDGTGITVRDSVFQRNGTGVVLTSTPAGMARGALVLKNSFRSNNTATIPPSGISSTYGLPFGTGIWIAGVANTLVQDNEVSDHSMFGILVSDNFTGDALPINNRVITNQVAGAGVFDAAWDGMGSNNCFDGNDFSGPTGPPALQDEYGCSDRPFHGTPYLQVSQMVDAAILAGPNRPFEEPPEPPRPACQKGKPGCNR